MDCAAAPSSVIARRRFLPSWRGGAAAEAIQWGRRSSHGRAVSCVGLPDSGLLRARFARARNDGDAPALALALAMTEGRPSRRPHRNPVKSAAACVVFGWDDRATPVVFRGMIVCGSGSLSAGSCAGGGCVSARARLNRAQPDGAFRPVESERYRHARGNPECRRRDQAVARTAEEASLTSIPRRAVLPN